MSALMARAAVLAAAAFASLAAMGQTPVIVYAAGSLRAPLTAVADAFAQAPGGGPAKLTFGASGLLRDRIAGGEPADVFASANMEHPAALAGKGWTADVRPFARNQMCVLAGPRVPVTTDNVLDVLLDPRWKLGTSTPKADPSGDYAWDVFRKADTLRPGAYAVLDARALKLTGGPSSPPPPPDRSVYGVLVANGDADVFLTYCTNARQAVVEQPALSSVALPANLAVGATYGIAVRRGSAAEATRFVAFLLSPGGQRVLAQFGFDPP